MKPLTALLVDDEPLALLRLRTLLRSERGVRVVGECEDGRAAVLAIRRLRPDLVFLDVQMPEKDGFEVLRELAPAERPLAVFATAFDSYAIQAFDAHAFDYLLKPIQRARLREAVARARVALAQREVQAGRRAAPVAEPPPPERLLVKTGSRSTLLRPADIDYVQAAGNYVEIHAGPEVHLSRDTLARLERELDPRRFVRIHRSTIVNVERVRHLEPLFHGDHAVFLAGGARLTLSRDHWPRLQQALGLR
jgi:two-component system LytT family response regulator